MTEKKTRVASAGQKETQADMSITEDLDRVYPVTDGYTLLGDAPPVAGPDGCSATIARLAAALAKAQGQIEGASKDASLRTEKWTSRYATLASVWDACRGPLTANNLAVAQLTQAEGRAVAVTTLLLHGSGEWIRSTLVMTAQTESPQAIGSCITYARRYALAAIVGVAPEDDDGNEASSGEPEIVRPTFTRPEAVPSKMPLDYEKEWLELAAEAEHGTAAYKKKWDGMSGAFKQYTIDHRKDKRAALMIRAAEVTAQANA